jgi:hypothetical protein
MSREVIEILCNYSHNNKKPLMIIASRNQVDAESGYVMTTPQIREQLSTLPTDYIWMCRDHCGPYFLDAEKNLSLRDAVEATKKTIAYDIEQGFNLIHIDTSRVEDTYGIAEELFKFCLDLNPNVQFEFGTEENVGVAAGAIKYKADVAFAKNIPNMQFVVAQTGSLTMEDRQVGSFDVPMVKKLVKFAEAAGVKLKEHNADYLTADQIQLRKKAGVHACNIAPQLGVIQTKKILELARKFDVDSGYFEAEVLASEKWRKWLIDGDNSVRIAIAGHYCFGSSEYKELENKLSWHCDVYDEVKQAIEACLNLYYENLL